MTARRVLLGLALLLAAAVTALELSGRQPERDAVAAAERELGIELEAERVELGGEGEPLSLFVVQAGPADGEPVVLLHGFPEFWYAWRGPLAVLAARGFRAIAPDQRGYASSDKPPAVADYRLDRLSGDVARLIRALGHESAFVAAHDWGGGVAWDLAIRHPERVRRLVVIDTPHPRAGREVESREETTSWFRTFFQIPWLPERLARLGNWRLMAGALRDSSRPGTFSEETLDLYRSAWDRERAMGTMMNWYRAGFRLPPPEPGSGDAAFRVRAPTLVVLAEDDAFIPSDRTRASLEWLEDGRLVELGTGTHWVIQEEPARIGTLLADFFSER